MQNAPRGFSHGIPHDNEMLVKQDGNGIIHTYICAVYITKMYMYIHVRCE